MVAEGPAVKMFERLQRDMIEDDREILFRVLAYAVDAGRLPADAPDDVDVQAIAPTLAVRNRLHDAKADEILAEMPEMLTPMEDPAAPAAEPAQTAEDAPPGD